MTEIITSLTLAIISFYSPGALFSRLLKFRLNSLEKLFFNLSLGIVLFTLLSYALDWLRLSSVLLPILILIILLQIFRMNLFFKIERTEIQAFIFIVICSIIFSIPMLRSGQFGETIKLIGINQSDSLWHLSLINELKNHFPPDNPGFSGVPLKGYHFFFNLILASLGNTFGLSSLYLYFRLFPILISFLWSLGVFVLVKNWTNNKWISYLAVFLSLFGGSFSFLLQLLGHKGVSLDDAFGITQPASSLVNPPFSISIVLLIAFLFSLLKYFRNKNKGWLLPILFIVGSASMFKVYLGILLFLGLIALAFLDLFHKKFTFLLVLTVSLLIFFSTYWVFRDPSSQVFFDPLWSPNRMVEANLPWFNFAEKYNTYAKQGVIKGLIKIETFALIIFVIGSLGTRIFGLIYFIPSLVRKKIRLSPFGFCLGILTLSSIFIPLFFIQSGKVFEMIQMTWYFLFLASIVASVGLYKLAERLKFNKILILLFIILTLPSAYDKINFYLTSKGEDIPKDYIQASQFLKHQGNYNSTVLELPSASTYIGVNTAKEDVNSWFGGSTPKLLALSNKRGYINNEFINFLGVDYSSRLGIVVSIIKYENDPDYIKYFSDIKDTLKDNKISYIYSPKPLLRLEKTNIIQRVFSNKAAFIYKVNL